MTELDELILDSFRTVQPPAPGGQLTVERLRSARERLRSHQVGHMVYLVQVRFPRSKRRRIRQKWARDWRNYRLRWA